VSRHNYAFGVVQIKYYGEIFVLGEFFANVCSPKTWRKHSQNHKMYVFIDCDMVSPISTCKFDAKNSPDAFKYVPELFSKGPGAGKYGLCKVPGPENMF